MNNFNQQPPTPESTPPTPSIPQAHQMMGGMPRAPVATAGTSTFLQNFIALLILVVGGGSLYFVLTKNNPSQSGTPVNQIQGFDLNVDTTSSEATSNEGTQGNNATGTNTTVNSAMGTETNTGQTNSGTTNVTTSTTSTTTKPEGNYKFNFTCKDVFCSGDFQKISGCTGAIEVNEAMLPNKDVPGGFTLMCSFTQKQQYLTSLFTVGVNFSSASSFANMKNILEKYSGETFTSIPNIGSEAFSSDCCGDHVFASNQKYFFSPVGANFFAEANATKERSALEALLLLNVQTASKIIDQNLSKLTI